MKILLRLLLTALLLVPAAWGAGALWFQGPASWRGLLVALWSVLALAVLLAPWWRRLPRRGLYGLGAAALAGLLLWWQTHVPSHARPWADDVAQLLSYRLDGSRLTLENVRNFDWRGEADYTPRWETRQYDLDEVVSADLLLSYWMGPTIAHTLVSFGFSDGRQLSFSMEIRKEQGEAFSALAGFFRRYESVLIAADENDIVRVRTNVRDETVRLYRLNLDRAQLRTALLGYLQEAAEIRRQPQFYNTLTSNCTTAIFRLARQLDPGLPLDHRLLATGHFAEYAHEHGGLVPGRSFAELQAASDITARARAYRGPDEGFSAAIREGIPK